MPASNPLLLDASRCSVARHHGQYAVWLVVLAALQAWLCTAAMARAASDPTARPNVVLILTDDQGWGDLGCHGNDKIDTPALDRLASESVHFDRFYVSPVCSPTRASLLTGRYHLRTGVSWVTAGLETMRAEERTLAELLKTAGYATGCFGKWHNGAHWPYHPRGQGFDEFLGFCGGHWNNYFDTSVEHNGRQVQTSGYLPDVLTDAALRFIERHRAEPFFCYLAYHTPHSPFQVPDRYYDKYRARGLDPKNASVYGMVENIDDNVGRLLARLDRLSLTQQTIVIFLSDNGPNGQRFNGGMRGIKGSVDEGGVRVPMFVRHPGRFRPHAVQQIAAHIDVLPTLAELCGVAVPEDRKIDGISLVPLLERPAAGGDLREAVDTAADGRGVAGRLLFTHQSRGSRVEPTPGSVRSQQYRLVNRGQRWELYDMHADPGQARDIAAQQPEIASRMQAAYEAWFAEVTQEPIERLPIPLGHAEAPRVELPAPEAQRRGGVRFRGAGWANDWLIGWSTPDDLICWELDVVSAGQYEVRLLYACPVDDTGSRLTIRAGQQQLQSRLSEPFEPAVIPSPDRVPRGEVHERTWGTHAAGRLTLPAGRTKLCLQADEIPGSQVMELKSVVLLRVQATSGDRPSAQSPR